MEPDLQNNTNILSEGTNRLYLDLKQHNHLDFTSNTTRTLKVLRVHQQPCRCQRPRWPPGGKWHTESPLLMARK